MLSPSHSSTKNPESDENSLSRYPDSDTAECNYKITRLKSSLAHATNFKTGCSRAAAVCSAGSKQGFNQAKAGSLTTASSGIAQLSRSAYSYAVSETSRTSKLLARPATASRAAHLQQCLVSEAGGSCSGFEISPLRKERVLSRRSSTYCPLTKMQFQKNCLQPKISKRPRVGCLHLSRES